MKRILLIVQRKIGIDHAVFATLVNRAWSAGANLITLAVLVFFLSKEEQGYYYTFASLFNLQVFFELGFTYVLTQFSAHEFARITATQISSLDRERASAKLSAIIRLSKRWFLIVAAGFWVIVSIAGWLFFHLNQKQDSQISWQWPWLLAITSFSFGLLLLPINAILEGCQKIKEVALIRTLQDMAGFVCFWLALTMGAGIYSLSVLHGIRVLTGYVLLKNMGLTKWMTQLQRNSDRSFSISWKREIFPFQWRITLSWLAGYLIYSLFTPVLFVYHGPTVAGQMGMTIAIFNGIATLSTAWITTKIPYFCQLIALNQYVELNKKFHSLFLRSMFINAVLVIACLLFIHLMSRASYGNKTLQGLPLISLGIACIANNAVFAMASYLRAFKEEPLLPLSLVIGLLTGCSTLIFGKTFSSVGISYGYMVITLFVALPYSYYVFKDKQSRLSHCS